MRNLRVINMYSYYVLSLFCVLFFLHAFFPSSNNQSSHVLEPPESFYDIKYNVSDVYAEVIDRVVIIVIDALRYDFVTSQNMPFVVKTVQNDGCKVLVKVESPTVTLPRIKALTTGSVPQFIDILFNLMSTEVFKDSLLHRAVDKGKKIVFYGDDTWLKIYPDLFIRSEGTSSFYVNDYMEVDYNVTRNVYKEVKNKDWDIMILHYLGLDHIGHTNGPRSPLVQPKLKEMDDIIKVIYESVVQTNKKSLILITGDHGMKDSGGHGGNTYSETTVPMILFGTTCKSNSVVAQTDIAVTLSALMGLTVPAESIGKVSLNILEAFFTPEKLLYVLRYNVLALQNKASLCDDAINNVSALHYKFLKEFDMSLLNGIKESYELCASKISNDLLYNSVKQNEHLLMVSSILIVFCFCSSFNVKTTQVVEQIIVLIILYLSYLGEFKLIITCITTCLFILSVYSLKITKRIRKINVDLNLILVFGCILHSISLTSSSFIEEEHQTWYFFMATVLLINAVIVVKESYDLCLNNVTVLIGLRFLRKLNQTGDKWASLPDLVHWLLLNDNVIYHHLFCILSVVSVWLCYKKFLATKKINLYLILVALVSIYVLKIFNIRDVRFAQIIWGVIFINIILNYKVLTVIENITQTWILVSCLLLRPYNIILVSYCIYASFVFRKQIKSPSNLMITHLWLGNVLFFCQGHSNSLASVDIAAGYIGLENYRPVIVTTLVLCHTYSLPMLSNLLLAHKVSNVWEVLLTCRLLSVTTISVVVFAQRHHLFVWTVFAPKLLIESAHSIALLLMLILYGIVKFVTYVNNIYSRTIKHRSTPYF